MKTSPVVRLFNLDFLAVTLQRAAELVLGTIHDGGKALVITPNVDHIVKLHKQPHLLDLYEKAQYTFVDGMPVVWFSHLLPKHYHLPERINGTNLMMRICGLAAEQGFSIALVGGTDEDGAQKAGKALQRSYPGLEVAGCYYPPFGFEHDPNENERLIKSVQDWKPNILFVGVGCPKQEKWIIDNWDQLDFNVALGIGSAIDFIAGDVKRAPVFIQKLGFEWLWRMLQEPKRLWKRYMVDDMQFFQIAREEYRKIKKMEK